MADNEPSCGKPGEQLQGILEREKAGKIRIMKQKQMN